MAPVRTLFSALLTVTAVVATTLAQFDPCTSYIELNDDRRSVAYEVSQVDNFRTISDFTIITDGLYYRFTSHVGERIPAGPVDNDLCGTFYPISMTEQHPEAGVEERTVCARAYGRSDCFWNATIEVRFCIHGNDSYIVYQLQRPPYGDMAYCAGERGACPRGQVWVKNACKENRYPAMTSIPTLSGPEVTDNTVTQPTCQHTTELFTHVSRFYFTCTVGYESLDEEARFDVTFWARNEALVEVTVTVANLTAILYEDYIAGHVGKYVSCSVVSYWEGESVYRSDELESNTYWMGIYPDNNEVLHERSFPVTFTLKFNSTIPVTCWHCKDMIENYDCSNTQTRRECSGQCSATARIDSVQPSLDCILVLIGRSGELGVQVKQQSGLMEKRVDEIHFHPFEPIGFSKNTFQSYQIENVKIITEDTDVDQTCMLRGDPHITTFDGRYYHAYDQGIYLVWKAPGGSVEIQAKFAKCGAQNHVACISAIAVREFNHVIRLNALLQAEEHLKDEDSTGYINVISKQNGQAAEILLSSGIQITATKWTWPYGRYLNVVVLAHASFKDKHMIGLCGNFDGEWSNDLKIFNSNRFDDGSIPRTFTTSYRISPNYFNSPPQRKTFSITREQCGCSNGNKIRCAAKLAKPLKLLKFKNVNIIPGKRRKRSTSLDDGADDWLDPADVYNYEEPELDQNISLTLEWPTASGITEEEATAICEQEIYRSPIADYCSQQAYNVTRDIVRSCVADIQITGSSDVGSGLATNMEDVCISRVIATTNMTGQELEYDNSTGRYVPDDLLPVVQQICPNQCSGHGDCINGSCLCQAGFSDIDCAVDLSVPPHIIDSLGGGLCNIAIRACKRTTLYVSNLLNSPKLMCQVFIVTQLKDGPEMQSVAEEPAGYVTASEVSCQLPESPLHSADPGQDDSENSPSVHTWYLSLTNDRLIYSEPHRYTLYDSLCQTCLNATACSPKPGTCDISQLCYIDGDPHSDDICRQCRSDVSMTQWSLSDNSPPELTTTAIETSLDPGEEQLEATDAEGHSITFRLISGSNVRVSEDGLLVWSALTGQDLDIEVAAMDQCGASVTNTVRITLAAEKKSKWTTILAAVVGGCVALVILVAVTIIACKKCLQRGQVAYQDTPYRPNASDADHAYNSIRPTSASSVPKSVVPSSVPASRHMFQPI